MPTSSATAWTMRNATAIFRISVCWKICNGQFVICNFEEPKALGFQITNYKSQMRPVGAPLSSAAMMKPVNTTASQTERASEVEPLLLEVADVVNTTLDLETTLKRVAELVRKVIDYEIFAILLLNEQRQELYVRFHVGYPPEVADRLRVKMGQGVTGRAAQTRQAVLVADATQESFYLEAVPNVHSELAIPLIVKNRVIGVIDIEAREKGYFTEEHKRLLTLIAS